MSVQIDITCEICGMNVGKSKVAIPLNGDSFVGPSTLPDHRMLMVDKADLAYSKKQHTRDICSAATDIQFPEWAARRQAKQQAEEERFADLWRKARYARGYEV